jgi:hypothetical protein
MLPSSLTRRQLRDSRIGGGEILSWFLPVFDFRTSHAPRKGRRQAAAHHRELPVGRRGHFWPSPARPPNCFRRVSSHAFSRRAQLRPLDATHCAEDSTKTTPHSESCRRVANMMKPPAKRARLGIGPYEDSDDDDEISMEPEEFEIKNDDGYRLDKGRAKSAFRLKSTFEHIFEKYERDFSEIGDEIDLNTGEIVVDNGHLRSMGVDGKDAGDLTIAQRVLEAPDAPDDISSDEEERILHGGKVNSTLVMTEPGRPPVARSEAFGRPAIGAWSNMSSVLGESNRLSSLFAPRISFAERPLSFGSLGGLPDHLVDPAWRVPELPVPSFTDHFRSQLDSTCRRPTPTKRIARKLLPMAMDDGASDEDDILLGLAPKSVPPVEVSNQMRSNVASNISSGERDFKKARNSQQVNTSNPTDSQTTTVEDDSYIWRPLQRGSRLMRNTKRTVLAQTEERQDEASATVSAVENASSSSERKSRNSHSANEADDTKQLVVSRRRKSKLVVEEAGIHRRSTRAKKQTEFYTDHAWEDSSWATLRAARPAVDRMIVEIIERQPTPAPNGHYLQSLDDDCPSEEAAEDLSGDVCRPNHETDVSSNADIVFASSDCHELESSRAGTTMTTPEPSSPILNSETFTRNFMDPSFEFSDEDNAVVPRELPQGVGKSNSKTRTHPDCASKPKYPTEDQEAKQSKTIPRGISTAVSPRRRARRKGSQQEEIPDSQDESITPRAAETTTLPINTESSAKKRTPIKYTYSRKQHKTAGLASNRKAADIAMPTSLQAQKSRSSPLKGKPVDLFSLHPSKKVQTPASSPLVKKARHTDAPSSSKRKRPSGPTTPQDKPKSPAESSRGLISLVSDDDLDELSLTPRVRTPNMAAGPSSSSLCKGSLLFGSAGKAVAAPQTPRTALGGSVGHFKQRNGRGGLDRRFSLPHRGKKVVWPANPTEELIRTPGGTMRRCGEDGFKCDRDFCFTCL